MINLDTGKIVKQWDFSMLVEDIKNYINSINDYSYDWGNNVLNGIAYNKYKDTFYLTGKMWDFVYEVKLDYRDYIGK